MGDKVLFVADNASQLKPAYQLAVRVAQRLGATVEGNLVPGARRVSPAQRSESGAAERLSEMRVEELLSHEGLAQFKAIVVFLTGSRLHRFIAQLRARCSDGRLARRPVLVTGYNGVVYEKHLEGILWRTGCDVISVNSEADKRLFTHAFQELGVPTACLCVGGLVLAQEQQRALPRSRTARVRKILFATQAIVPGAKHERVHLLEALREYARAHPDRTVCIKPRTRPGENTFHYEHFPYEELDRKLAGTRPPNLRFEYGPLSEHLEDCDLLVTVSSTALFEALVRGVRTAVLTDLGVRETFGNHFFLGSGLFSTMAKLMADELPSANEAWLADNGFGSGASMESVVDKVVERLDAQKKLGHALPFPPQFYGAKNAPYILETSLGAENSEVPTIGRLISKLVLTPRRFFQELPWFRKW